MDDALRELAEQAASGDPDLFRQLLDALRARTLSADDVLELARSDKVAFRRAAAFLAPVFADAELDRAAAGLAGDASVLVRRSLAEGLAEAAWWLDDSVVARLLTDAEFAVRQAAVRAAAGRPTLEVALVARLSSDDDWRIRQEVARLLGEVRPVAVVRALLAAAADDDDNDVRETSAAAAERHFQRHGGFPEGLARPPLDQLRTLKKQSPDWRRVQVPLLLAWVDERVRMDTDYDLLRGFGTVLSLDAEAGRLAHAYTVADQVETIWKMLCGAPPRAVVLLGESGVGKTALVNELTYHLLTLPDGRWDVLRVAPSDFLAGTSFLGEWETKLHKLLDAIRQPHRVVLYVPNLEELASVGVSSKTDSNVASALAPYVERGDVVILGESTAEGFRSGLGAVRNLRRLFHAFQLNPAEPDATRDILHAVAAEADADVPGPVLDRLQELADFYASGTAQPGRAVGLLRRVLAATAGRGPFSERDVLATVATSTGVPADFLDDAVPLDRVAVRAFFEARVMGQPEAVDAVVDLVTLIKAGLTDPNKPFGVLLFVGPTGVGKTELARSLAELLFGDPGRLLRLDMSEYASFEAFERLIGRGSEPGQLTAAVRERPFSVLLFDEIEKGHLNVFDLCLQVFDAGRLTDARGRTVDFRRTIIVLTSNVGSTVATEVPLGFGRQLPAAPGPADTLRELGRVFRPEFLNRIDRVVTFRPLSAETAEQIARREVARVVERSGIARRKLVVDVEPAVLPLLLREGYSPAYGARPLKRTVERLVLLPVARAIAGGEAAPGSVLRLVARKGRVEVEIVEPPDTPDEAARRAETDVSGRAAPVAARAEQMLADVASLRDSAAPLTERKSDLLARAAAAGFWDDRTAARAVYDELFRLDGVLAALDRLGEAVREQAEAATRPGAAERDLARVNEALDALEGQAGHVGALVRCRDARDLGDAYLVLTRVGPRDGSLDAVATLARMYLGLARRHALEAEVLDDRRGGDPTEDVIVLLVNGAGAHVLLAGEAGLHQMTRGRDPRGGRRPAEREVVRVEVLAVPYGDDASRDPIHIVTRPLADTPGRLLPRLRLEVQLRHEPTLLTLRAWTDRSRPEALEGLLPLLRARIAAAESAPADGRPPVVRRYDLGPAPLVRDSRTGRTTGRVEQVLEGDLDRFLNAPPGE